MSLLGARQAQQRACEYFQFQLQGVSFHGRQRALSSLREGNKVVLQRERGNRMDPGAVLVTTLGGRELGYVPKEKTDVVVYEQCFGQIASVGGTRIDSGSTRLGASVVFQPHLPPLAVELFPSSLAAEGRTQILQLINPDARSRITHWALERSGCCCQVCGVPCQPSPAPNDRPAPTEPVLHEDFVLDDQSFTAVLRSVIILCGHCTEARQNLLLVAASIALGGVQGAGEVPIEPATKSQFEALNGWRGRDVQHYAYGVAQRWQRREEWRAQWRVDDSWLAMKLEELDAEYSSDSLDSGPGGDLRP